MSTRLISGKQVKQLLTPQACIAAVEKAFQLYGEGKAPTPGILGIHVPGGGFHTKAGTLDLHQKYYVTKTNANFPQNNVLHQLPTIQGVVAVFDATNGRLLALMDSIELTILRTGAATAVAAKFLARPDAKTLLIHGCGNQGRISLTMLSSLFRFEMVFVCDVDNERASKFAKEFSRESFKVLATTDPADALHQSDICVTCTTAKKPFIRKSDVVPGTFIAAVGADSEDKQELEPEVLASAKVVTDVTAQCMAIGELHHAVVKGILRPADVHAELGEIVAGKKPARTSREEIIVFDSTGMALQDVASAAIVYERASEHGIGLTMNFAEL